MEPFLHITIYIHNVNKNNSPSLIQERKMLLQIMLVFVYVMCVCVCACTLTDLLTDKIVTDGELQETFLTSAICRHLLLSLDGATKGNGGQ